MFRSTFKSLHYNIFKFKINNFSNNPQKNALDNIKNISSIHLVPNYKIPSLHLNQFLSTVIFITVFFITNLLPLLLIVEFNL